MSNSYVTKSIWLMTIIDRAATEITYIVAAPNKKDCKELVIEREDDNHLNVVSINKIGNLAPKFFKENYPSWEGESVIITSSSDGVLNL